MELTENKILNIIKSVITEDNNQMVDEHNYLVSLLKQYNSLPLNHVNKKRDLFKTIQRKAQSLSYSLNYQGNILLSFATNGKQVKTIAIRKSQSEIDTHKMLEEYSQDFQSFVKQLFTAGNLEMHGLELDANPNQAQSNIVQGKKTVAANNALDALERMFDSGYMLIKPTRFSPSVKLPIVDYFKMFDNGYNSDDEDYDAYFRQSVGESKIIKEGYNETIKNNNIMKLENKDLNNLITRLVESITNEMDVLTPQSKYVVDYFKSKKLQAIVFKNDEKLEDKLKGIQSAIDNGLLRATNLIGDGVRISAAKKLVDSYYDEKLDESTFEIDADDSNMQSKISKIKNDSTLFNKDTDEIKITSETKTYNEFASMVNEARKEKSKNDDYLKAIKKADRELDIELNESGFKAGDKAHKDKTKYDGKNNSKYTKSDLIEMFTKEKK